jgi:hypothetical protein
MKFVATLLLPLLFFATPGFAQSMTKNSRSSSATAGSSTARFELLDAEQARDPLVYFGINTAALGVGVGYGAPVLPIDLGIRIAGGLSIGPTFTFSGTYRYQETDFKLSGIGGQLLYNFGHSAIADGFFLTASYQRYSVSATQMMNMPMPGGAEFGAPAMAIPMEGSAPVNAYGAGLGYQWVWKSGLRLAAGVRAVLLNTDADGINLMGMNREELNQFGQAMNAVGASSQVDIPVIENRSQIVPLPEISLGWAI